MDTLLQTPAIWFTIPAIVGTLGFGVRLLLMLAAGDGHGNGQGGADLHADHGADHQFELLSVQSVLAFMMGFGWGGLGALRGSGLSPVSSSVLALASGAAMMFLLAFTMRSIRRLSASGNIALDSLTGATGEASMDIPSGTTPGRGSGEVRLVIGDRERRCQAVSVGEAIPSRARVRVVTVNSDNTVTVERL
ncbi:MAG: hypothetical protein ACKVS8_00975 [Phycisphaerales bacterium]